MQYNYYIDCSRISCLQAGVTFKVNFIVSQVHHIQWIVLKSCFSLQLSPLSDRVWLSSSQHSSVTATPLILATSGVSGTHKMVTLRSGGTSRPLPCEKQHNRFQVSPTKIIPLLSSTQWLTFSDTCPVNDPGLTLKVT